MMILTTKKRNKLVHGIIYLLIGSFLTFARILLSNGTVSRKGWYFRRPAGTIGQSFVGLLQALRNWSTLSRTNNTSVDTSHRGQLAHGTRGEHFFGSVEFGQTDTPHLVRNAQFGRQD